MNDLSRGESEDLARCEAVIERGLATFVEVGTALLKIRDARLYRLAFGTFEEYCRERWGMSKTHANRMIDAAGVVGNLTPIGVKPQTESQTRPLASLCSNEQQAAWDRAVETAPNGHPTANHVRSVVDEMFPRREPLDSQSSFLGADDEPESGLKQAAKDVADDAARIWTKVLGDYCQVKRSVERIGGIGRLCRNWKEERIEEAVEFSEELARMGQEFAQQFRRCLDERR